MNQRNQSLFALVLTLLFLIVAPLMILYALGYRLAPPEEGFRVSINPTGGIRVSTRSPYNVTLDGERLERSPVFKLGLEPGTTQVTLSQPGFQSWEKTLEIEPYLVTLVDSVILFPTEPEITQITDLNNVTEVVANPLSDNILYSSQSEDDPGLWLYNPQTGTTSQLVDSLEIDGSVSQEYQDITWDESGQQVLFRANILNQDQFFIISNALSPDPAITNISELFPYNLDQAPVEIVELTGNTLTFIQGGHIFQIDLVEQERSEILVSNVATADLVGNILYYVNTKENDIRAFNTLALTEEIVLEDQWEQPIASIQIPSTETHILVFLDDQSVYWQDLIEPEAEFGLLEGVSANKALFGAEDKKALLVGENQVNILYLDTFDGYQNKTEGDLDQIYASDLQLSEMRYFGPTQEHVTFIEDGILKVVELDARSTPNVYELGAAEDYSDVLVGNQAVFVIHREDMLYRFEFPFRRGLF